MQTRNKVLSVFVCCNDNLAKDHKIR